MIANRVRGSFNGFCTADQIPVEGSYFRRLLREQARAFSERTGVLLLLAAAGVSLAVGIKDLHTSKRLRANGHASPDARSALRRWDVDQHEPLFSRRNCQTVIECDDFK